VIESCYEVGGLKTISFSRPKQRFPSTALIFDDLAPPLVTAALERLFGPVTVAADPPQAGQAHPSPPAKAAQSPSPIPSPVPVLAQPIPDVLARPSPGEGMEKAARQGFASETASIASAMRQPMAAASGQKMPHGSSAAHPVTVVQSESVDDDEEYLEQGEPGEYEPDLEEFLQTHATGASKLRVTWQNSYRAFSRSIETSIDCGKIVMTTKPRNGTGESEYEAKE
jgi:hypothetical protein